VSRNVDYYREKARGRFSNFDVILANNVCLEGDGEYMVQGMAVDEKNVPQNKVTASFLFVGDKQNLSKRELLIGDGLVEVVDGILWIRILMEEGGGKETTHWDANGSHRKVNGDQSF